MKHAWWLIPVVVGCQTEPGDSTGLDGTLTVPNSPTQPDPTMPSEPTSSTTVGDVVLAVPRAAADCMSDTYPVGAVEPMAFGEVLSPYSWPAVANATAASIDVDLASAPCGLAGDIDWSPFDVLLFVSIPAW